MNNILNEKIYATIKEEVYKRNVSEWLKGEWVVIGFNKDMDLIELRRGNITTRRSFVDIDTMYLKGKND